MLTPSRFRYACSLAVLMGLAGSIGGCSSEDSSATRGAAFELDSAASGEPRIVTEAQDWGSALDPLRNCAGGIDGTGFYGPEASSSACGGSLDVGLSPTPDQVWSFSSGGVAPSPGQQVVYLDGAGWSPGSGGVVELTGPGQRVALDSVNAALADPAQGASASGRTVTAWVRPSAMTGGLFSAVDANDELLVALSAKEVRAGVAQLSGSLHAQEGAIQVASSELSQWENHWQHIAMVWQQPGTLELYVNAESVGRTSLDQLSWDRSDARYYLGWTPADGALVGLHDDLRVFPRALSQEELAQQMLGDSSGLMVGGNPVRVTNQAQLSFRGTTWGQVDVITWSSGSASGPATLDARTGDFEAQVPLSEGTQLITIRGHRRRGYVTEELVVTRSSIVVEDVTLSTDLVRVGRDEEVQVRARVTGANGPFSLRIRDANGDPASVGTLADDGLHGDEAAGDGLYGGVALLNASAPADIPLELVVGDQALPLAVIMARNGIGSAHFVSALELLRQFEVAGRAHQDARDGMAHVVRLARQESSVLEVLPTPDSFTVTVRFQGFTGVVSLTPQGLRGSKSFAMQIDDGISHKELPLIEDFVAHMAWTPHDIKEGAEVTLANLGTMTDGRFVTIATHGDGFVENVVAAEAQAALSQKSIPEPASLKPKNDNSVYLYTDVVPSLEDHEAQLLSGEYVVASSGHIGFTHKAISVAKGFAPLPKDAIVIGNFCKSGRDKKLVNAFRGLAGSHSTSVAYLGYEWYIDDQLPEWSHEVLNNCAYGVEDGEPPKTIGQCLAALEWAGNTFTNCTKAGGPTGCGRLVDFYDHYLNCEGPPAGHSASCASFAPCTVSRDQCNVFNSELASTYRGYGSLVSADLQLDGDAPMGCPRPLVLDEESGLCRTPVLGIVGRAGSVSGRLCTAAKISDKHLLTAAHCVHGFVSRKDATEDRWQDVIVSAGFDPGEKIGITTVHSGALTDATIYTDYTVKQVHVHPSWLLETCSPMPVYNATQQMLDARHPADVAIIELVEDTPYPMVELDYDFRPAGGVVVEPTGRGSDIEDETRLAYKEGAAALLDAAGLVSDDVEFDVERYRSALQSYLFTSYDTGVDLTYGDSGGPVFFEGAVVAVNSNISGVYAHARLDDGSHHAVGEWIRNVLGGVENPHICAWPEAARGCCDAASETSEWNPDTRECQACPIQGPSEEAAGADCACSSPKIWDPIANRCACPEGMVASGSGCACPAGQSSTMQRKVAWTICGARSGVVRAWNGKAIRAYAVPGDSDCLAPVGAVGLSVEEAEMPKSYCEGDCPFGSALIDAFATGDSSDDRRVCWPLAAKRTVPVTPLQTTCEAESPVEVLHQLYEDVETCQ